MAGPRPEQRAGEAEALLIVAHGDRAATEGGERGNLLARRLAGRLAAAAGAPDVALAFIRGEPSIAQALETVGAPRIRIYPLFLSDGYYVRKAIPERVGQSGWGGGWRVEPPLGLDPDLPGILLSAAKEAVTQAGLPVARTTLLLAAHGSSKSQASASAAERIAAEIAEGAAFARVATAYLEQPPLLQESLETLPGPLCLSGLFAGEGLHGGDDLSRAVAQAARPDLVVTPALARNERLLDCICTKLLQG